jgi:phosphoribosylaminoimidazole-succinocarboxamide synthase
VDVNVILAPELPTPTYRGKVRDLHDLGDRLLVVATDRLSAFDVVLPTAIPAKGEILTQISLHWFGLLAGVVPNHLAPEPLSAAVRDDGLRARIARRCMLVRRAQPLRVEAVVRGFLSGSGWQSYRESREVCGVRLPAGLRESDQLAAPIFTPTTKAPVGEHDEPISFDDCVALLGGAMAERVRDASLALYARGAAVAAERGLLVADTKFEFGLVDGELTLIDEVLSPDSSRFWDAADWTPGGPQKSYDKQFVRDYLNRIGWDRQPPGPELPSSVVEATVGRYIEAFERITGRAWPQA